MFLVFLDFLHVEFNLLSFRGNTASFKDGIEDFEDLGFFIIYNSNAKGQLFVEQKPVVRPEVLLLSVYFVCLFVVVFVFCCQL